MTSLLDDISWKIDLQRDVHAYYEIKWKRYSIFIKTILIVFPAFLTFAAFSDFNFLQIFLPSLTEHVLRLSIGLISFVLFLVGVVSELFGVVIRHEQHRDAIEKYSELRREIREVEQEITNEQLRSFNQRYIAISNSSLSLSTAEYRKAVGYRLRDKALRGARKRDPFGSWWAIRKSAIAASNNENKTGT